MATGVSHGRGSTTTCAPGSMPLPRMPASRSSSTAMATSGRGGVTPTDARASRVGSHLDSVPDGGAFDGPLGVVSAPSPQSTHCARTVSARRGRSASSTSSTRRAPGSASPVPARGCSPARSTADRARGAARRRRDHHGRGAAARPGSHPHLGRDERGAEPGRRVCRTPRRTGPGLADLGAPVALASGIWPHGRWRLDFRARRTTPGTTRLADRRDPTLDHARLVLAARARGRAARCVGNLRQGRDRAQRRQRDTRTGYRWLDARGPEETAVRDLVAELAEHLEAGGHRLVEESWTPPTAFDAPLRDRLAGAARRAAGARHRRRPRRGDPGRRRNPQRHAVRAQPDRDFAFACRVRRARRLFGRSHRADRGRCDLLAHDNRLLRAARLAGWRAGRERPAAGRRRPLRCR